MKVFQEGKKCYSKEELDALLAMGRLVTEDAMSGTASSAEAIECAKEIYYFCNALHGNPNGQIALVVEELLGNLSGDSLAIRKAKRIPYNRKMA